MPDPLLLGVSHLLNDRIRRNGPITFAEYQSIALYDPDHGFFAESGAGRAEGDFITSPEVGPLFGVLVARFLDQAWVRLGTPDPFFVVEVGAGNGRLAATILNSEPNCSTALRYVLVETSARHREEQRQRLTIEPADEVLGPAVAGTDPDEPPELIPRSGPLVTALDDLPAVVLTGVVLANELLDNLPVRIVERGEIGWLEVRVGLDSHDNLTEVLIPASADLVIEADLVAADVAVTIGARIPVPEVTTSFLGRVGKLLDRGEVVLIDYGAPIVQLLAREKMGWLRTYRAHERGSDPYADPGTRDITCDVPLEYLALSAHRAGLNMSSESSQAQWLNELGIDDLVAAGRAIWEERAHLGDLEALVGRSRGSEAQALTDPAGLGGHRVIVLKPR